ncbi:MAG: HD domain-containing protein [Treponema sp.]|nr:HD domain-containing protein [Treponema sp.]
MEIITEDIKTAFIQKLPFSSAERQRILGALESAQEHSAAAISSVNAASVLLDLGMDADTITAALIRQLPEPSQNEFGPSVISLIHGVLKITGLKTNTRTNQEAQNIRNMIFALTDDIRVIFIILSEKLTALRFLDTVPLTDASDHQRKTAARECLDIFAPLADRLGISWIKNEIEDISLKFLNRETYQQIKSLVSQKRESRRQFLQLAQETLKKEVAGIPVEIETRSKHFYSIYMKMRKRGISAEKIFDLSAMRVICGSIENCYLLLGIVHRLWKPVSGCFKDYIANPKPNGYRSLHTTVVLDSESEDERMLEIQIRTAEMHQIAENGVASHWLYKKGSSRDIVRPDEIGIVNKLKDWKQIQNDSGEISPQWFLDIRKEILRKWIYVFTPQGKVIKLPAGATPIDFAFYIHTAVGEHCIGAKANGSIISLSSQLTSTQTIEILTSPSAHPHLSWLELAKSARARSKIRVWLERNEEVRNPEKIQDAKKKELPTVPPVQEIKSTVQKPARSLTSVLQVSVENERNMMLHFARCCNPMPGDSITGYVSRGRGVIIHRTDCVSLAKNVESENRRIDAEWRNTADASTVKSINSVNRGKKNRG